jgi:Tfp pilus assembly protein PilE
MFKRFWKGLRLIEIAIMVTLIIFVIIIIFSRYENFACRSMQSEAKFSLQQIVNAQMLYHAEHDYFASIHKLLEDQRVVIGNKYYDFNDSKAPGPDNFTIVARGKAQSLVAGDLWSIDEKKQLINSNPVCIKP